MGRAKEKGNKRRGRDFGAERKKTEKEIGAADGELKERRKGGKSGIWRRNSGQGKTDGKEQAKERN